VKILIIGSSWIGDLVLAQSLFKVLYAQYQQPRIDVLAPAWSRPVLDAMPEVHQSMDMPVGHGELQLKQRKHIANKLQVSAYDWAIILPNSFKSALIPWLAKIPIRTGWRGEFRYGLLNDIRTLDQADFAMMVQRYVGLAYPSGTKPDQFTCPNPRLKPSDNSIAEAMAHFCLNTQRPILALCPGAQFGRTKKWPARHFQAVAGQHLKNGGQVWLFGAHDDRGLCEDIVRPFDQQHIEVLAGGTSLQQAIALLSQVDQVVSNDSGLMHIAAALGRPIVAVYGATSEFYTPPLSKSGVIVHQDIDCRPCQKRTCPYGHYHCLEQLQPEKVISALDCS